MPTIRVVTLLVTQATLLALAARATLRAPPGLRGRGDVSARCSAPRAERRRPGGVPHRQAVARARLMTAFAYAELFGPGERDGLGEGSARPPVLP